MSRRFVSFVLGICCNLVFTSLNCGAQQPMTGAPPLSSISGGPFDSVDLANLDVHFSIPVFSRAGKGIPFTYNLTYDSLVWFSSSASGPATWTPVSSWGWAPQTTASTGHLYYPTKIVTCTSGLQHGTYHVQGPYTYFDPSGTSHTFNDTLQWSNLCPNQITSFTDTATDNSGLVLSAYLTGYGTNTVSAPNGAIFLPPTNTGVGGSVSDPNGNSITTSSAGAITDTLGSPAVLTISGTNPVIYSYTAPSGATAQVQVNYSNYMVATHFGVSGIAEYYFPNGISTPLVSSITMPDNTQYILTYEATAGGSPGTVTGRIASVTLPTGGTITYSYGTGANYMMADGSPWYTTRSFGGGTWQYWRAVQSGQPATQTTTTVLDPAGNETDLNFSGIYETQRKVYQGNSWWHNEVLLKDTFACYNGNFTSCQTASVTAPIIYKYFYDYLTDVGLYKITASIFDQNHNSRLQGLNDYGYTAGQASIIRYVTIGYNDSLCNSLNICDRPSGVQVNNQSSQQVALTNYGYDGLGNVTSVQQWVSGSSNTLTQQYSYNPGGTLSTATDPNGTITNYGYGGTSCNNAFPTSVTVSGLTTNYGYNCTGAVVTSVTDPNHATVSTAYSDSHYWRPASVTDQMGNVTNYSYPAPGQVESVMNFTSAGGNSTSDVVTTPDSLGRPFLSQTRTAPGSSSFDTVETDYDASGNVAHTSLPFTTGLGQSNPGAAGVSASYDGLGRPITVTDSGGGSTSYTYNLNDVFVNVAAPSPENAKRRQFEYDALGHLTSVCEITNVGGSGSCGQQTAATGFLTSYTYDPLGGLLNVSQSGQTRTFTYDGVGRMLSENHPETSLDGTGGTTSYAYDLISSGYCQGQSSGDKLRRTDPAGNVTCYTWDTLHRLTGVSYPTGLNAANTASKTFYYDNTYPHNISVSNTLGRLSAADTYVGGQWNTAEVFSYNARGEVTDFWQNTITPYGNWYHLQQSYFANGVAATPRGYIGTDTSTPFSNSLVTSLDGKGRPVGITDASWSNTSIWSGTTYTSADQPQTLSLLSGAESFGYDPNSGRMTQWTSSAASSTQTGNLTWNGNGTLKQLQISDNFNTTNAQTCAYGYDDLARLLSANCTPVWSQTFSYDVFGNITKTGSLNFNPGYGAGNHVSGQNIYDGMGNLIVDNLNYSYTYDAEGRPLWANGVRIYYDAFGRAVNQNRTGSWTQIVYAPSGSKFAFMTGLTVQKYLAPLAGGLQAVYTGSGLQYYRHADWLGSSRFAAKPNGTVYYDGAYAPFGENYAESGTTDRSFTSQTPDTTTGLYDFLFRQQSSSQGRWLVPDPAGLAAVDISNPQTWNRYAYVANNSLSNVDPLGLFIQACWSGEPNNCIWSLPGQGSSGHGGGYYGGLAAGTYIDGVQQTTFNTSGLGSNGIGQCPPGQPNCIIGADNQVYQNRWVPGANGEPGGAWQLMPAGSATTVAFTFFNMGIGGVSGYPLLSENAANNGPPTTPVVQKDNGKSMPNVPPEWGFCSKYRDGSGGGEALYQLCMAFPNGPWSNCVRGKLLNQYTPTPNPFQLVWYLGPDHAYDFATCAVGKP